MATSIEPELCSAARTNDLATIERLLASGNADLAALLNGGTNHSRRSESPAKVVVRGRCLRAPPLAASLPPSVGGFATLIEGGEGRRLQACGR